MQRNQARRDRRLPETTPTHRTVSTDEQRLTNRNDKRISHSVTHTQNGKSYPSDWDPFLQKTGYQNHSERPTGRTPALVLNQSKIETIAQERHASHVPHTRFQTSLTDHKMTTLYQTRQRTHQTTSQRPRELILSQSKRDRILNTRDRLVNGVGTYSQPSFVSHRRTPALILNQSKLERVPTTSSLRLQKPLLEKRALAVYTVKKSTLLLKKRYDRPIENNGSAMKRSPLRINRAEIAQITRRRELIYQSLEQSNRKPLQIKTKQLHQFKKRYATKRVHLFVSKTGSFTKFVTHQSKHMPAVSNRVSAYRQGMVLDRLTNKLIHDHLEQLDTGYQALYSANRKRKSMVRLTKGAIHFAQATNRNRYLLTGTRQRSVLQAQGMTMSAMESANPVTDTGATATSRTATHVKTTKELLKKGKNIVRGKNAIRGRNAVRDRNRFARIKGVSRQTAKAIQKSGIGLKKIGGIILVKAQGLVAGKGLIFIGLFFAVIMLFGVAMGGVGGALEMQEEEQHLAFSSAGLSADVLKWKETVEKELSVYNLTAYTDLILVLIQLESDGILPDVMQASESIGLPPNSITDPLYSIKVGVAHFKRGIDDMNAHNVDIQTLIQAYNFGNAFIPYVAENGAIWKQAHSDQFARLQAQRLGWSSYGDTNYVSKAMAYLTIEDDTLELKGDGSFDLAGGKLVFPVPHHRAVSSSYGWRTDPFTYERSFHSGTDIPAPAGTAVVAAADGIVIESGWKGGYGNAIVIDHGSGLKTLYGHNSSLDVQAGQTVKAGQVVARVGTTGRSTGNHSHFEVMQNGNYTDPMQWFK